MPVHGAVLCSTVMVPCCGAIFALFSQALAAWMAGAAWYAIPSVCMHQWRHRLHVVQISPKRCKFRRFLTVNAKQCCLSCPDPFGTAWDFSVGCLNQKLEAHWIFDRINRYTSVLTRQMERASAKAPYIYLTWTHSQFLLLCNSCKYRLWAGRHMNLAKWPCRKFDFHTRFLAREI